MSLGWPTTAEVWNHLFMSSVNCIFPTCTVLRPAPTLLLIDHVSLNLNQPNQAPGPSDPPMGFTSLSQFSQEIHLFHCQFSLIPITFLLHYLTLSLCDLILQSLTKTKVLTTPTCPQPTASHHFLHQLSVPNDKNAGVKIICCRLFPPLFPSTSWSWWILRGSWQEQASHSSLCEEWDASSIKPPLPWKDEKIRKRGKEKEITNLEKKIKKKVGVLTARDHVMWSTPFCFPTSCLHPLTRVRRSVTENFI